MFVHLRMLLSIFSFMAFTTDPGNNGDPPEDPDEKKPPKNDDPPADRSQWTVEQWTAEVQRIAAKEKAEGRKAAEREAQQKQEKADEDAALAKQESEGKYEEAKQRLTSDLASAESARDQALELLKANVEAQWDGLPDAVKKTYTGDEDDVLAKSSHMNLMKPIIAELAEKEKSQLPGNRPNPTAANGKFSTEEERAAQAQARQSVRPI